ncbi:unnamed protein product, partial [Cladocopium goreaui]
FNCGDGLKPSTRVSPSYFVMMFQVNIVPLSGESRSFEVQQSSKVGDLSLLARESFGGFLQLLTAEGRVLSDPNESLEAAGLRSGDHLTVVALRANIAATAAAFALWCGGKKMVTWGHAVNGGDSSAIQDQLRNLNVKQVQATRTAFAAILEGGRVVAWGDPEYGGM